MCLQRRSESLVAQRTWAGSEFQAGNRKRTTTEPTATISWDDQLTTTVHIYSTNRLLCMSILRKRGGRSKLLTTGDVRREFVAIHFAPRPHHTNVPRLHSSINSGKYTTMTKNIKCDIFAEDPAFFTITGRRYLQSSHTGTLSCRELHWIQGVRSLLSQSSGTAAVYHPLCELLHCRLWRSLNQPCHSAFDDDIYLVRYLHLFAFCHPAYVESLLGCRWTYYANSL